MVVFICWSSRHDSTNAVGTKLLQVGAQSVPASWRPPSAASQWLIMLFIRFDFNNLDPERIESNRAYRKTGELTINEFANARRGKSNAMRNENRYQPWTPPSPALDATLTSRGCRRYQPLGSVLHQD